MISLRLVYGTKQHNVIEFGSTCGRYESNLDGFRQCLQVRTR